jgi:5-methyltetrahydropteroyltriglutamate--homocysteine methyltransferase
MSEGLLTTSVGSFPKPEYLTRARSQFSVGKIGREELAALERQATAEVIRLQEEVGLDILVHGEMERGDMVAYFAELLTESMAIGGLVRSYGNRYYRKPIIIGGLHWQGPMTVEMWRYAQGLTDRPVKGMLTGPYTMVEWSFDEHYPSRREAVLDMARLLREEVEALVEAGAKYIQIDEPAIHTRPEEDFDLAVEAMALVVDGIDCEFHTHICYGEVGLIYPGMLRLPVKQIHLAFKNTDFEYLKLLEKHPFDKDKELGVGVVDVHSHLTETVEEVEEGIRKTLKLMPPERVWIEPDCGLKTRTWEEAAAKLRVMVQAVREVRRELGIEA